MRMITLTLLFASTSFVTACGGEDDPGSTGPSSTSGTGAAGAGGAEATGGGGEVGGDGGTGGTGGTGGMGGMGGMGGEGGAPCHFEAFNIVDLTAPYAPPGLPFEGAAVSVDPLSAAASVPGSPLHYWDFEPNFGGNDVASVELELTCHNAVSTDLELSIVQARFLSGDWKFTDVGDTVVCGANATFNVTKPAGPEPSYFYRVRFAANASPQYIEYSIGAASAFTGTPGLCIDDGVTIEPSTDDVPSAGEALSAQAGTISAPFGNTVDFISDPALNSPPPQTEAISASLSCTSPHLELRIVTSGNNGQLNFSNLVNSNDKTLDCGESGTYGINYVNGQAQWFAMVTVKDTYDQAVDGPLLETYSVDIQ